MSEGRSAPDAYGVRGGHLTHALSERDQEVQLLDPPPAGSRIVLMGYERYEVCLVANAPEAQLLVRRLIRGYEGTRALEWPVGTEWRLAAFDHESRGALRLIAAVAEAIASEQARGSSDPFALARALFDRRLIKRADEDAPR